MNDPSNQNGIHVAEVRGHHHYGADLGELAQLFYFSYDVDLVAQGVLASKEGAKLLHTRAVEQSREPKSQ